MTKDEMLTELRQRICHVRFKKADGTERDLVCTLNNIPEDLKPLGTGSNGPEDQIRVLDTEINEWRSFKVDSVISFV